MGFVKDWGQLVVTRVLLGVLEAGYFPGCVYLLSCWYTRCENINPKLQSLANSSKMMSKNDSPFSTSLAASPLRWQESSHSV
jgi:MFS family permease